MLEYTLAVMESMGNFHTLPNIRYIEEESGFMYNMNRNAIVRDAKKYKSRFDKYLGSNTKFYGDDKESYKWFVSKSSDMNSYTYLYLNKKLSKAEIKEVIDLINSINEDLTKYHFKLDRDYGNSIKVCLGSAKEFQEKCATKSDYDKAIALYKKLLQKYPTLKPAFSIYKYEDADDYYSITILEYDTWKIKWSGKNRRTGEEYDTIFEKPFEEFYSEFNKALNKIGLRLDSDGDEEYGYLYIKPLE